MFTLAQYIEKRDNGKHTCRNEEDAVKEAIDILLDNRFTGVDIVTFITADRDAILQALNDRVFPNGKPTTRPRQRE